MKTTLITTTTYEAKTKDDATLNTKQRRSNEAIKKNIKWYGKGTSLGYVDVLVENETIIPQSPPSPGTGLGYVGEAQNETIIWSSLKEVP